MGRWCAERHPWHGQGTRDIAAAVPDRKQNGSLIYRVTVLPSHVRLTIYSSTPVSVLQSFRSVEKYNEPQINADERRSVNPVSAFICVHLRLIELRK